jgi:hypothetical protein
MLKFLKNSLTPTTSRTLKVSKAFGVPLADYATTGERDAILASSGMGKSYLTGVLMEETLENAGVVCIIDPEGEHFTLAERYPMLIVGGDHGNVPLETDALEVYIETMLTTGLSIVFDLSEHIDADQQQLYAQIADTLFKLEQKYRRKVRLIVEEAQIYAPQSGSAGPKSKGKKLFDPLVASQRIAKRGRKRAIDSLWATQRPASISKDILSQCNRFWFGGITSEQDYKAVKPFLAEAGITHADIKSLHPGEFFFYSKGKTVKVQVRKRYCKHAGATPESGMNFHAATDKTLEKALSGLLTQVEARTAEKRKQESESERLKAVIRSLEEQVRKLEKELNEERLASRVIDRLGSLPPVSSSASGRRSSRKKASDFADDGSMAEAASEVRTIEF